MPLRVCFDFSRGFGRVFMSTVEPSNDSCGSWLQAACAIVILLLVAGVGLWFRGHEMDLRPVHHDEANQMLKFSKLLEKGEYRYDPHQHHGPTLYYLTLPSAWLSAGTDFEATTVETYRIVPVIFGVALILLLVFVKDGLGWEGVIWAGILTALSPAMVYYSQFYIQEMLLVFFTLGVIACGWRYYRSRRPGWAAATGAFLALTHATKETCVLAAAAMVGALVLTALWTGRTKKLVDKESWNTRHVLAALGAGLVVWLIFFSSCFTNPMGLVDSVRTYWTYLHRAGGDAMHTHPWYFYLRIFTYAGGSKMPSWTEIPIVGLAVVGLIAAVFKRSWSRERITFARFITIYTLLLTAAYSIIPYKTPWSGLSALHGMILMAGVGCAALLDLSRMKTFKLGMWALLGALLPIWGEQCYRTNVYFHSLARNPYAYAQTGGDFENMIERVHEIAEVHPEGQDLLIRVVASPHNTWPMPWYLRRFKNVGYWTSVSQLQGKVDAPLIITSPRQEEQLKPLLKEEYQRSFYGIRPEVLLRLYIRKDLWEAFLKTRM